MQFVFIPMRNCKIFLLGVTSQEGTPMVPPKPLKSGTRTPQFCFFPSRFPNAEVLRYHQADFLWVLHVFTNAGHGWLQGPRAELHHRTAGTWHKGKGLPEHLGRQKKKSCQQALAVNWGMAQQTWKGDVTRGEEEVEEKHVPKCITSSYT